MIVGRGLKKRFGSVIGNCWIGDMGFDGDVDLTVRERRRKKRKKKKKETAEKG